MSRNNSFDSNLKLRFLGTCKMRIWRSYIKKSSWGREILLIKLLQFFLHIILQRSIWVFLSLSNDLMSSCLITRATLTVGTFWSFPKRLNSPDWAISFLSVHSDGLIFFNSIFVTSLLMTRIWWRFFYRGMSYFPSLVQYISVTVF